jgi:ribosomal protein S18 acetylase RimI-like enzyme
MDLAWALDRFGAYVGGTDRDTDDHLLSYNGEALIGILKYRRDPGELHLAHLIVRPDYRDRGAGSTLLDSFLSSVRATVALEGFVVTCEVVSGESEKVRHMLEKRGFVAAGCSWKLHL